MFCPCAGFLLKRSCLQTHVFRFLPTAAGNSHGLARMFSYPHACLFLVTRPSSDKSYIFIFAFIRFISVSISSISLKGLPRSSIPRKRAFKFALEIFCEGFVTALIFFLPSFGPLFFTSVDVETSSSFDPPRDHPGKHLYCAGTFWLYLHSHCRLRNVQRDFGVGVRVRFMFMCVM